jgi:hypothetical protein
MESFIQIWIPTISCPKRRRGQEKMSEVVRGGGLAWAGGPPLTAPCPITGGKGNNRDLSRSGFLEVGFFSRSSIMPICNAL